ncbi:MAG: hypothetical protein GXP54_10210 [Deltaproteobacteria bacterium]|nr:hypothetical protein [Deltaproteobacteria bacterium]
MSASGPVITCLRSVAIEEVRKDRLGTLERHFTPSERAAVKGRAAPTVAGMLALKLAVRALSGRVGIREVPQTREIELGHESDGRPLVRVFPGWSGSGFGGSMFVSISHDQQNAWGVATLQQGEKV